MDCCKNAVWSKNAFESALGLVLTLPDGIFLIYAVIVSRRFMSLGLHFYHLFVLSLHFDVAGFKSENAAMLFISTEFCWVSKSQSMSSSILQSASDIKTGRICPSAAKCTMRANIENVPGSVGHSLKLLRSNQKVPRKQNPPL